MPHRRRFPIMLNPHNVRPTSVSFPTGEQQGRALQRTSRSCKPDPTFFGGAMYWFTLHLSESVPRRDHAIMQTLCCPICRLSNLVLVLLVNDGEYHNGITNMSMSAFSPAGITQPWNHGCNVAAFVHTPGHTHIHRYSRASARSNPLLLL